MSNALNGLCFHCRSPGVSRKNIGIYTCGPATKRFYNRLNYSVHFLKQYVSSLPIGRGAGYNQVINE